MTEEADVSIELCFPTADNAETGNQMCCTTEYYQTCDGGVWSRPEECGVDTSTCYLGKNEDIEVVDIGKFDNFFSRNHIIFSLYCFYHR